jgi:hypothetical protein
VKADAELDPLVDRRRCIALDHASLHLGRTLQRIHHTAKVDKQAITRRLDQPAIVRGDRRIEQLSSDRLQSLEGAALVCPDQS